MARDISERLEDLGLGKYADAFAENEIDFDALPHVMCGISACWTDRVTGR